MPSENKNKLKQEKDDINLNYQSVGKYIDTDPYSYISDLIIQFSKNITNGRGLSQAGVNSLSLFILTAGLLYNYTVLPTNIVGLFKLYIVPLLFFLYFLVDLSKNIPYINNFYMRIFKRSNFAYYAIINNSVSLEDLEEYLRYKAFNSQQLEIIVEHLIKEDQFSPTCQANLMCNKALYEIKSAYYMKDLLLRFDFTSHAVCIFLEYMEERLDNTYLDKLIEKYVKFPSVLFSVGKFHKYKIDDSNPLYKYGYEWPNESILYDIIISPFSFGLLLAVSAGYFIGKYQLTIKGIIITIIISIVVIFVSFVILRYIQNVKFGKAFRKYLMDKKNLDKNTIERIIEDLYEPYI